jgi:CheY-like chemotaxis protein
MKHNSASRQAGDKPQIVYFCTSAEMADLLALTLSQNFEVTALMGVGHVDDALNALYQIKPDYVLVDPRLSNLDCQQLHRRVKADPGLNKIQILIISDDYKVEHYR